MNFCSLLFADSLVSAGSVSLPTQSPCQLRLLLFVLSWLVLFPLAALMWGGLFNEISHLMADFPDTGSLLLGPRRSENKQRNFWSYAEQSVSHGWVGSRLWRLWKTVKHLPGEKQLWPTLETPHPAPFQKMLTRGCFWFISFPASACLFGPLLPWDCPNFSVLYRESFVQISASHSHHAAFLHILAPLSSEEPHTLCCCPGPLHGLPSPMEHSITAGQAPA